LLSIEKICFFSLLKKGLKVDISEFSEWVLMINITVIEKHSSKNKWQNDANIFFIHIDFVPESLIFSLFRLEWGCHSEPLLPIFNWCVIWDSLVDWVVSSILGDFCHKVPVVDLVWSLWYEASKSTLLHFRLLVDCHWALIIWRISASHSLTCIDRNEVLAWHLSHFWQSYEVYLLFVIFYLHMQENSLIKVLLEFWQVISLWMYDTWVFGDDESRVPRVSLVSHCQT